MKSDGSVSASEISQYSFCSVAWYMDDNGYPRSTYSSRRMEHGREMHEKLEPRYKRSGVVSKISLAAILVVVALFVSLALGLV